jgi:polyhydroxybutyrate depolymerase
MKLTFLISIFILGSAFLKAEISAAGVFHQKPIIIPSGNANREDTKVYLPDNYDQQSQWPMVMVLHGYSGYGDQEDFYLGLRFRVNTRKFILVVPNGTIDQDGKHFWNATDFCCDLHKTGVDDTSYLLNLVKFVQTQYRVDPSRIYIIGHSNGGFMANRLTCDGGSLFAGIATLAGTTFKDPTRCRSTEPVSVLHIHAVDDPTIKFGGDTKYPGAEETINRWLHRDQCSNYPEFGPPLDLSLALKGDDASDKHWKNCRNNTEVALWTMRPHEATDYPYRGPYGPHIPPLSLNFTDLVLDFLFAQTKQGVVHE